MKKPRPIKAIGRKRRTLGWSLLTLSFLVAGVWVASGWWGLYMQQGPNVLTVLRGVVQTSHEDMPVQRIGTEWTVDRLGAQETGWDFRSSGAWVRTNGERWDLWIANSFDYVFPPATRTVRLTRLALWPIPLLLCTPAAFLLHSGIRARRRALTGICTKCGYNLAGLALDAPCPECGKAAQSK